MPKKDKEVDFFNQVKRIKFTFNYYEKDLRVNSGLLTVDPSSYRKGSYDETITTLKRLSAECVDLLKKAKTGSTKEYRQAEIDLDAIQKKTTSLIKKAQSYAETNLQEYNRQKPIYDREALLQQIRDRGSFPELYNKNNTHKGWEYNPANRDDVERGITNMARKANEEIETFDFGFIAPDATQKDGGRPIERKPPLKLDQPNENKSATTPGSPRSRSRSR